MSPRPTKARRTRQPRVQQAIVAQAQPVGELTPLQWLLYVVNDLSASEARRDRAAIASAPYVHPRPLAVGKKQREAEAAGKAGADSQWADDLAGWEQ